MQYVYVYLFKKSFKQHCRFFVGNGTEVTVTNVNLKEKNR